MESLWVSWEYHRRNIGISSALGCSLHQIEVNRGRLARYLISAIKTVKLVAVTRPGFLFAQNPSIVLALLLASLKPFWRYKLIIDAHTGGIIPFKGRRKGLMLIARWLQKKADLTIVTNAHLKGIVERNQGAAFILPDGIPVPPRAAEMFLPGRINVVFVCTYSEDEPYREVVESALHFPSDIHLYFTGSYSGKLDPADLPRNIHLLGFVPEDQYWSLLAAADLVLVLTTRENCLVCGAYEGVSLGKPLILSDTLALRAHFRKGVVHVRQDAKSIAEGILQAAARQDELAREVLQLKEQLIRDWRQDMMDLRQRLREMELDAEPRFSDDPWAGGK
jgi:glycosyltransferase involved in cell wall biosynthesis